MRNVVRLKPVYGSSRTQRTHRQIAWALYITEGYAANMRHALESNSYDL